MQSNEVVKDFVETYRCSMAKGLDLVPVKTSFNVNFRVVKNKKRLKFIDFKR